MLKLKGLPERYLGRSPKRHKHIDLLANHLSVQMRSLQTSYCLLWLFVALTCAIQYSSRFRFPPVTARLHPDIP